MLFLVSCSSTPSSDMTRADYINDVQASLDRWEKKADRLTPAQRSDLRAKTADARAELRRLEAAPDSSWRNYKPSVDTRVDQIQLIYGSAD